MIFSTWWKLSASVSKGSQMKISAPRSTAASRNISLCDEETCHLFGFTEKNGDLQVCTGGPKLQHPSPRCPRRAGLPWTRAPAPTVCRAGAHRRQGPGCRRPWSRHGHNDQELCVQTCRVQVGVSGRRGHHRLFPFFATPDGRLLSVGLLVIALTPYLI